MEAEVIYISSDDESTSLKENKMNDTAAVSTATSKPLPVREKVEILSSDDEKVQSNKRKISQVEKQEITHNNVEKKKKLCTGQGTHKVVNKKFISNSNATSDDIKQPNKHPEVKKPKLVVKEKKRILYVTHDIFPLFISLCLQKSRNGKDKEDMEKIVIKLKRRYEDMDPIYANSKSFTSFLNEKRDAIKNNGNKKYVYIEEVMNQMKSRKKSRASPQNSECYDAVPSTSYATNNLVNNAIPSISHATNNSVNNAVSSISYATNNSVNNVVKNASSNKEVNEDVDEDVDEAIGSPRTRYKIKQVQYAMEKCEMKIKKLEEEEVDFEREKDSTYMQVDKYKEKMVELFNKLCELTGENADAGRVYLRPKHFSTTCIVAVDQAITSFVNSKITLRNQMKKVGTRLTDDLIFPDYNDILACVNRCNDRINLGLDQKRCKQMAKKAFVELGEYLQRARQYDYWDTLCVFLDNAEEDPAVKDQDLARKLAENRTEGDRRLAAVFDTYTQKQEEMKESGIVSEEDEEEEEEEEESIPSDENKNKDTLSIYSTSDENEEEKDVNKTCKENGLAPQKSKSGTSVTTGRDQNTDGSGPSVSTSNNTPQKKFKKRVSLITLAPKSKIEIPVKESEAIEVPECESKTMSEKTSRQAGAGDPAMTTTTTRNVCTDTKKQNGDVSLPTSSSAANCASNFNRVEEDLDEVITEEITDPVTKTTEQRVADATGDLAESRTEETAAQTKTQSCAVTITENKIADIAIARNETEMILEDVMEVIEMDMASTKMIGENNVAPGDKQLDEEEEEMKKPRLRVCSFAKPPTTWEDNRHKGDKPTSQSSVQPKVTNRTKDVIDLTSETTTSTTTSTTTTMTNVTTATIMTTVTTTPTTTSKSLQPVITKYGLQIGDRVVPMMKRQTVVLPPGRNIINVQNITNNYLKVNKRTGQIVAPARAEARGSMIIRLPPIQNIANRQNQPNCANAVAVRNEVPLKANETIVRIIQPNKPFIVSTKSVAAQPVCDQADMDPAKKSK